MYAYLKGTLIEAHPSHVIIEVRGIGYSLFIPCRALGELPILGQPVQFYTSFVVREFSHALYGFLTIQERDLFELLMNITGVGPKLALSLIGHLSFHELHAAVMQQNLPTLCKVPGVGKKTAERLVVELKDKLQNLQPPDGGCLAININLDPKAQMIQDAMLALINLGYNQSMAQRAIKQTLKDLPEEADLALLITSALKNV